MSGDKWSKIIFFQISLYVQQANFENQRQQDWDQHVSISN